ncbi:MAG: hypothetical protein R3B96_21670 [Pirellulaceae bacterium]
MAWPDKDVGDRFSKLRQSWVRSIADGHSRASSSVFVVNPDPALNAAIVQAPIEAKPSRMHVLAYSPKQFLDKDITDLAALSGMAASHSVCWIDVVGLADVGLVKQLGEVRSPSAGDRGRDEPSSAGQGRTVRAFALRDRPFAAAH